jgi:hypothetical protein
LPAHCAEAADFLCMLRSFLVFPVSDRACTDPGNPKPAGAVDIGAMEISRMLRPEYLRKHIDALLRLSHDVKDRAVSAELREMADEFRIFLSVADISDFAAELNERPAPLGGSEPQHIGTALSPV